MYTAGMGGEREKFCPRCATPELRNRVAAVDQAARELRIVTRDSGSDFVWHRLTWPYGPNIDLDSREALVEWAAPLGLRQSATHNKCLHWLRGKQCPRNASHGACGATVPGADHLSVWNRGPGRTPAVLVSQPYGLFDEDLAELTELAKEPDLVVEVDESGGWYGAGTTWVAIWNAARHPSASATAQVRSMRRR